MIEFAVIAFAQRLGKFI